MNLKKIFKKFNKKKTKDITPQTQEFFIREKCFIKWDNTEYEVMIELIIKRNGKYRYKVYLWFLSPTKYVWCDQNDLGKIIKNN